MKKITMTIVIALSFLGAYGQDRIPAKNTIDQGGFLQTPAFIREIEYELTGKAEINLGLKVKNQLNGARDEYEQVYAVTIEGAVHIGDGYSFDNDNNKDGLDHADIAAREHVKLFVEDGIATENMTYIFKEDWDDWPDYVFEENYDLLSLSLLKTFIDENKHLPKVPSQAEVRANGVSDKKMGMLLLEKVEELTLYSIRQEEKLQEQEQLNDGLLDLLEALETQVKNLTTNDKSE